MLLTACQTPGPSAYQFNNLRAASYDPTGTFTCLGITDQQWKSVLKPGSYRYIPDPCRLRWGDLTTNGVSIVFAVWGMPDGPDSPAVPQWDDTYRPYLFYQYPTDFGDGGALWQYPHCWGAMATPTWDAIPVVVLAYPTSMVNPNLKYTPGVGLRLVGDWRNNSPFSIDTIAAMILLVQWAAYGLTQQYPNDFISLYPTVNPSPYLSPHDGTLPTATTTLPPIPPPPDTPASTPSATTPSPTS